MHYRYIRYLIDNYKVEVNFENKYGRTRFECDNTARKCIIVMVTFLIIAYWKHVNRAIIIVLSYYWIFVQIVVSVSEVV